MVRMSELLGEREKSDLNDVGPKELNQIQLVRPVTPTGQTGLAQADRRFLTYGLVFRFKLIPLVKLKYS